MRTDSAVNHEPAESDSIPHTDLEQRVRHCERSAAVYAVRGDGLLHCVRNDGVAHEKLGQLLLQTARCAISSALGQAVALPEPTGELANALQAPGASFVTLNQREELRGCIGSLQAHRPLITDIQANAVAAALHDSRFAPLTLAELDITTVEVSVLSAMQPLPFACEADALAQLRPGVDGVVFECGRYRSTFLPQVWEQLPNARQFMAHLKHKAGLAPDFWAAEVRLQRYTVSKFKEVEGAS